MARNPGAGVSNADTTAIDLSRLLARLQHILVTPDSATETKLRSSSYEREKVEGNLQYARSLLLRLEQDALKLKIQTKKQETQADLVRKRETLQMLNGRLHELNELGAHQLEEDESSEGENILGEDTPGEDTELEEEEENNNAAAHPSPVPAPTQTIVEDIPQAKQPEYKPAAQDGSTSALRARNRQAEKDKAELLSGAGSSTGLSTATTEALLTHNRTEQESLTNSLLAMAQALKSSSRSFATALEDEKTILNRATEGLDKNELGLEAAQRRMGFLRTYTEGKGWWGRMLMYAWIAGLMVIALVIVFVLPKLRF